MKRQPCIFDTSNCATLVLEIQVHLGYFGFKQTSISYSVVLKIQVASLLGILYMLKVL